MRATMFQTSLITPLTHSISESSTREWLAGWGPQKYPFLCCGDDRLNFRRYPKFQIFAGLLLSETEMAIIDVMRSKLSGVGNALSKMPEEFVACAGHRS